MIIVVLSVMETFYLNNALQLTRKAQPGAQNFFNAVIPAKAGICLRIAEITTNFTW